MKKNYFFTLLLTFLGVVSYGQTLITENFDYGGTAGNLTTSSGGVWVAHSGAGANPVGYITSSLTMASYPSSGVGGAATIASIASGSAEDVSRTFTSTTTGSVYASSLVSISQVSSGGDYFMHFRNGAGAFFGRTYAKDDGSGKVLFGIRDNNGTINYGTTPYDLNTTYLLVLKYDLGTKVTSIYILSAVNATEPVSAEASSGDGTTKANDLAQFAFRQSTATPAVTFDGVRVATSWNDLMNESTTPSLSITAPGDGTEYSPEITSVDVKLSIQNFNVATPSGGDGYIKYTVNSNPSVDKFDTSDINLTSLTPGAYTVVVELVDNAGASLAPAVTQTVNFTIASYNVVANLAALRAGTVGNYYHVTGEVVLTYARTSRNQKYVQDVTAGVLIDDAAGTITTTYNTYDGITNLKGQLSSFSGVTQFIPSVDSGVASSTGNTITPEVVTLADFEANSNNYESELIQIQGVTFTAADGVATFTASTNYEISSGGTLSNFRTNFSEADYIGQVIQTTSQNIVVLGGEFNGDPQVTAINLAGFTLGVKENNIEGFAIYPNPVTTEFIVRTSLKENSSVTIFNILGKQVLTDKLTSTKRNVNVSNLSSGIYLLKVVENGKTATKKLVIR